MTWSLTKIQQPHMDLNVKLLGSSKFNLLDEGVTQRLRILLGTSSTDSISYIRTHTDSDVGSISVFR
jgi:hypothetical protein